MRFAHHRHTVDCEHSVPILDASLISRATGNDGRDADDWAVRGLLRAGADSGYTARVVCEMVCRCGDPTYSCTRLAWLTSSSNIVSRHAMLYSPMQSGENKMQCEGQRTKPKKGLHNGTTATTNTTTTHKPITEPMNHTLHHPHPMYTSVVTSVPHTVYQRVPATQFCVWSRPGWTNV